MDKIKKMIKRSSFLVELYNSIFYRPIINLNKTNNKKKALLSYSVYPFKDKSGYLKHPNFIESFSLNENLSKKGYDVDVYNNTYKNKINYEKYDLIIGEGLPISNYFKVRKNIEKKIKTIYYATGSHPFFNNISSYERLFDFYKKKNFLPFFSSRIIPNDWGVGASLSDSIIIIGNEITKKSFEKYSNSKEMYTLNPPFYSVNKINNFDKKNQKKFLWFGSYGLIHKGLDLVIEAFLKNKDLELHICGYLDNEKEVLEAYRDELNYAKNIKFHGFLDLKSETFKELMDTCSFVVLASSAEGCATAVITAMGNGGLIPIVTKETGITLDYGIEIQNLDNNSLSKALEEAKKIKKQDLELKFKSIIEYVENNFSIECFKKNLEEIFKKNL